MKTIGIWTRKKSSGLRRMFDALSEFISVRFEERIFGDSAGIDAWILQEPDTTSLRNIAQCDRHCYIALRGDQLVQCGKSATVEFSKHHALPVVISGRRIQTDDAIKVDALPKWLGNATPIAFKGSSPIWAKQEGGGRNHDFVALSIPELDEGESLFQCFYGNQFLHMLPLLLFLRGLTDEQCWEPPPLQACFMFDDPNLHWGTYGHINFEEMIRDAQQNNYHVSFATIPLDSWFTHMPTAAIFKEHSDRVSLLIHGNDHIDKELSRACSDMECESVLRQALWRIAELERQSGVEISKVMAPPHGACSERFLEKMGQVGFEAACISRGSLQHHNQQANWIGTIGMRPSDIISGLPVFPRFRMAQTCKNSILVAALLHQPIIPVGHQHDIAEGLQLLADLSGYINSLGSVHWHDMKGVSRSNFSQRFDGKILRVRMFTKRIEIRIPEGIQQVFVEKMWTEGTECESLAWQVLGQKMEWSLLRPDETIPALSGQKIEIASLPPPSLCKIDIKYLKKRQLWPMVRRQLTEARDRVTPFLK